MDNTKIVLEEKELPEKYLNLSYYLKRYLGKLPEPPLHPGTKKPVGPQDLAPLFPLELIKQEVSLDEYIPIPEEVRAIYCLYRPTPLIRAKRLEKVLDTPAHIYFKYEGVSPVGSHKLNTALAQAYYNKKEGIKRLTTETGAGQWGTALSLACNFFGLKCTVYMVKVSFAQKPYRRVMMETFGAEVFASPSKQTAAGRKFLEDDSKTPGSLGMAISEAVEDALGDLQRMKRVFPQGGESRAEQHLLAAREFALVFDEVAVITRPGADSRKPATKPESRQPSSAWARSPAGTTTNPPCRCPNHTCGERHRRRPRARAERRAAHGRKRSLGDPRPRERRPRGDSGRYCGP